MEADCYRSDTKIRVFCPADLVHRKRKKKERERRNAREGSRDDDEWGSDNVRGMNVYFFREITVVFQQLPEQFLRARARARGDKWHPRLSIGAKTARFVSVTDARASARIENAVSPEKRSSRKLFPRRAINCCRMSGKFMRQEKEMAKKKSLERT